MLEPGDVLATVTSPAFGAAKAAYLKAAAAVQLWQKNLDYFGVTDPLLDGWVEIRCADPITIWYGYATVIDQATNDSVYRPAVTRQSSIP